MKDFKSLLKEYKENIEKKEKELREKEKFLEKYSIQLNEKEDDLNLKEKAIQKFLKNEIDSIIQTNSFPKDKREPLIKKIIQEILLTEAEEIEEDDLRERKFVRNEYKKLKHNLLHELDDFSYSADENEEEDDLEIDDLDIERIKQELKDELDYLEKRHPGNSSHLTKQQDLIDFRTFDPSNSDEEFKIIENYLELYKKAKSRYNKFVFLTFITGIENKN